MPRATTCHSFQLLCRMSMEGMGEDCIAHQGGSPYNRGSLGAFLSKHEARGMRAPAPAPRVQPEGCPEEGKRNRWSRRTRYSSTIKTFTPCMWYMLRVPYPSTEGKGKQKHPHGFAGGHVTYVRIVMSQSHLENPCIVAAIELAPHPTDNKVSRA